MEMLTSLMHINRNNNEHKQKYGNDSDSANHDLIKTKTLIIEVITTAIKIT